MYVVIYSYVLYLYIVTLVKTRDILRKINNKMIKNRNQNSHNIVTFIYYTTNM